jgi:hypothetical protein
MNNRKDFDLLDFDLIKVESGKKDLFLWDIKQKGLAVRVFSSGKKTFIYQEWVNGKNQRLTIGDAKVISVSQARVNAAHHYLKNKNINPMVKNEGGKLLIDEHLIHSLIGRIVELENIVYGQTEELF